MFHVSLIRLFQFFSDCLAIERCNRDMGAIVESKLSFSDHITEKVNKPYSILGL